LQVHDRDSTSGTAPVADGEAADGEPVALHPVRATVPAGHVPATLTREWIGGTLVLRLHGEIDLLSAPCLGAELAEQLHRGPEAVIVDLAGVTFLAVSGLTAMLQARQAAATAGIPLRLARPSRPARRCLELSGLAATFDVHDDLPAPTWPRSTS
jgi:anti-sigma B factor antagonist